MEQRTVADLRDAALAANAARDGIDQFVAALVLVRDASVLLLQRSADDFMGSIFELPGGEVEPGDALRTALVREVHEETSLSIAESVRYVGLFDYPSQSGRWTTQFTFLHETPEMANVQLHEHAAYVWFPFDRIGEAPVTPEILSLLQRVVTIAGD